MTKKADAAPAADKPTDAPAPATDAAAEVATVKMDLPRARVIGRRAYGPGQGVDVPADIAAAITAEDEAAGKSKSKKKGAK